MNEQNLPPEKDQAERFLTLLDEEAEQFTFQTFDDTKGREDERLTRVLNGTLDAHWNVMCELNRKGAGVYVTVNETDLQGRKKTNITRVRALFQEQDRAGCPELPTAPHIEVESSPGKHHRYVLVDGCPLDGFNPLQERMVQDYGSDPDAKDISRVLRLPGFFHQKDPNRPHLVRITAESGELPLPYAEAIRIFPPVIRKPRPAPADTGPPPDMAEVQSALSVLNPDMGYNDWLAVGFALHDWSGGSATGLAAWDTWSSNGALYRDGECEYRWSTFDIGGGVTIKTIFGMAAKTGWRWESGQTEQEQAEPEEWQEPIPLDQPDLPTFDAGDFPPVLWSMIESIARATETPPELAGMNVLAVAAAACQRKLTIELKPGYCEPLALWTATQLPPGSRKSAAQKPAIRPLLQWEIEQAQALAPVIKAARATRDAEELRLKELQKKFGKEQDVIKREALREEIEAAEASLTEVPRSPRIVSQDITPEQLSALMAQNGERLALFSSEGGVFSIMAGRYSGGIANLDIYLQAHSADPVRVDRGSRPSVYMQEPALTMGLSVQPDVLCDMASKPGFRGRGLVGRFLFCTPRDIVGRRTLETVPMPETVAASYAETITALLNMDEQRNMGNGDLFTIRLSEEASTVWREFALWVESAMAEGGELEHMRDWAGKLPGAAGRIAGIFHCIGCAKQLLQAEVDTPDINSSTTLPWEIQAATATPDRHPLTDATMQMALNLARKLVPHAIHTYAVMGEGSDIQAARRILRWIEGAGIEEFSARDCHYALKGTFQKRADLDPGLAVLMERGFIRRVQPPKDRKQGRPTLRFEVNPAVRRHQ